MIVCLGCTPAAQRVMIFSSLQVDEVNRAQRVLDGAAGKSVNVAKVLSVLGQSVVALGFVGGDRGAFIRKQLEDEGVLMDFVEVAARTRECVTVVETGTGRVTELVEESAPVTSAEEERLLARLTERVREGRALVLSGTLAGGMAPDFYRRCLEAVGRRDMLTVLDAKGEALLAALPLRPGLVKPNLSELRATMGKPLEREPDLFAAMEELLERGAERVVVTAGRGATLAVEEKRRWRILSPAIDACNPIGSGDAFTAGVTWRLLAGDELGEACRWGAACGAANALSWMAGDVDLPEVRRLSVEACVVPVS